MHRCNFPVLTKCKIEMSKNVENWDSEDIICWMCKYAMHKERRFEDMKIENFTHITMQDYLSMSREEFIARSECEVDGEILFESKEELEPLTRRLCKYIRFDNKLKDLLRNCCAITGLACSQFHGSRRRRRILLAEVEPENLS